MELKQSTHHLQMTTTTASMASAICTPYLCPRSPSTYSFTKTKTTLYALSTPAISYPRAPNFRFPNRFPQLGFSPFLEWNGLRQLGISVSSHFVKPERKGKCRGKGVFASLFGVGAPEALVIGVVALLVFGPKGLAEVARTLGKTLRQFQPTIKELQEVSREFKSTLEREIGLDELRSSTQNTYRSNVTDSQKSTQNTYSSTMTDTPSNPSSTASSGDSQEVDPNGSPSPTREYSSEEYLKITEEQLKASAALQERQTSSGEESQAEKQALSEDPVKETAAVTPPPQKPESNA